MAVRADLTLDFNNCMTEAVGPAGVPREEIVNLDPSFREIHRGLNDLRHLGQLPLLDLPYQEQVVVKILRVAERVRADFREILLLGIGGSALGAVCLQKALIPPFTKLLPDDQRKTPRLFVCDHLDAAEWKALAETLDLKKTLVIAISKSGRTTETLAALIYFRDQLKKRLGEIGARRNLLIITDPKTGPLRALAASEKIESFDIPPGIGGRFSVLTPVGLFPAACLGIPIREILEGARRMDERCRNEDLWFNPAAMAAAVYYLADKKKGCRLRVVLPYGERLKAYGDWVAQLWAESLGKRYSLKGEEVFAGPTPVRAVGVTDQHSQLQLYLEGPRDKIVTFVGEEESPVDVMLPELDGVDTEMALLKGQSVHALQKLEREATERALTRNGRPNITIRIKSLTPGSLGQLLFMSQLETIYSGHLYNVNPFDQPGVELIKRYVRGFLGDPTLKAYRAEIEEARRRKSYQI